MVKFTEKQFKDILEIGIMLAVEKNHNHLFGLILENAMTITNCDGGTLYLAQEDSLAFKIMRTISMNVYEGSDGEIISLPPVPLREENVCAYSAIHRQTINIQDVYHNEEFDFSGPKSYDSMTGYHTKSILVIPLQNHENELIGVLQLINAMDEQGNVTAFDPGFERIVLSLASQAAISISNMRYIQEIKGLLYSFVEAMATVVDRRTPYNANHTRNVAMYASEFVDYLNQEHRAGRYREYFDSNRKEQLVLAASLHDIGKMTVPLSVMNKATRLDSHLQEILTRFELIRSYLKIDFYENRISREECRQKLSYLENAAVLVQKVNTLSILPKELEESVIELSSHIYKKEDGEELPYLSKYERDCLLIHRGTLTDEERKVMEDHVVMTSRILDNIHFNYHYRNVPLWAGSHHELLDGSGYPMHLTAEQMPAEIRILALADIFDALTAKDRPYKEPVPLEEALRILRDMAEHGKLDRELVELFAGYTRQNLRTVAGLL